MNLEIENDEMRQELRYTAQIVEDLERKLDTSLEEIAILQSELEETKSYT